MKRSKLITMAISLLAAICLWAYVVTVVNPDGDTIISGIPVTFSGQEVLREDQQLVIKGDYTDMVSVHFYGKNTDLKKLEQYKDEISSVVRSVVSTSLPSASTSVDLSADASERRAGVCGAGYGPQSVRHHHSGGKARAARD